MGSSSSECGGARRAAAPAVGGGEQDAGQLDAAALTARQRGDPLAQHALGQAEVGADAGGVALGGVPAERGEALLDAPVLAHGPLVLRAVDQLGHRRLRLLHLAEHLVEAARGQHPVLGGDGEVALAGVLRQVADRARARGPLPAYGSPSPASTRIVVVLPAPLRPTRPIRSPGCTRSVASDSRMRDPARSSRSVAVIKGDSPGGWGPGRAPWRPSTRSGSRRPEYRSARAGFRRRVAVMTDLTGHGPAPRHRGQPRHRPRHRRRAAHPRGVGDDHRPQARRAGRRGEGAGGGARGRGVGPGARRRGQRGVGRGPRGVGARAR